MSHDLQVTSSGHVATIEICRPPLNYFDLDLIRRIADHLDRIDGDANCRAVVLAAQGRAFCAGANFGDMAAESTPDAKRRNSGALYIEAVRIFRNRKPIVAAVHGAAIGGGLGLAMSADFRLGFHPGFGLTVTLPEAIGQTNAALMFYTSRRFTGEDAFKMGLANVLVAQDQVRTAALTLAAEIAENSPLGLISTRATMRAGLADRVKAATDHELDEQSWLRETADFAEGVKATAERRVPNFAGC